MQPLSRTALIAVVALAALMVAFRSPQAPPARLSKMSRFGVLGAAVDTGGSEVSLDSAMLCIARYDSLMKSLGFSADGAGKPLPREIRITRSRMITSAEVFSGKKMLAWLQKTGSDYESTNKTLMIRVALGVYDANYLDTYHHNEPLLKKNYVNRIAIFMIPYDSAGGDILVPHMAAARAVEGAAPASGKGFDLGGLQP